LENDITTTLKLCCAKWAFFFGFAENVGEAVETDEMLAREHTYFGDSVIKELKTR